MRVFGLHPATLAATCLLVLGGCGGVIFEHPLSDDETTWVDERLIGIWELDLVRSGREEPAAGELTDRLAVGRAPDGVLGMEGVLLAIEDDVVKVERLVLRPTRIGEHRYLSVPNPDAKKGERAWYAARYDVGADGFLRVWLLEEEAFAAAVDAGELVGEVQRGDGEEGEPIVVSIRASTVEVRKWIHAHAVTCVKEKSAVFRRLVKRPAEGRVDRGMPAAPPAPVPLGEPDDDSEGSDEEDDAEDEK